MFYGIKMENIALKIKELRSFEWGDYHTMNVESCHM